MKKSLLAVLLVVITTVGLLTLLVLIRQRQTIERGAAPSTTISLQPSNMQVREGDTFRVDMSIDTGVNQIVGIQSKMFFKTDYVEVQAVELTNIIPGLITDVNKFDNTTGEIELGFHIPTPPDGTPYTGSGVIASLIFTAKAQGSTDLTFDMEKTLVGAIGVDTGINVLSIASGSTITILPPSVADTTLILNPEINPVTNGQKFNVTLDVSTGNNEIIGTEVSMVFKNSLVVAESVTLGTFFPNGELQKAEIDNDAGTIDLRIYEPIPGGSPQKGDGQIAIITFNTLGVGDVPMDILQDVTYVAGTGDDAGVNLLKDIVNTIITIIPAPTATLTPTPTRVPTLTPTNVPTSTLTPTTVPTSTLTPTNVPTSTLTPTSTVTPTVRPDVIADINRDGCVDILDYSILFSVFGLTSQDPGWVERADLVVDGVINILDYSVLFQHFHEGWSCSIDNI